MVSGTATLTGRPARWCAVSDTPVDPFETLVAGVGPQVPSWAPANTTVISGLAGETPEQAIESILRAVEAGTEPKGWGQPSHLIVVFLRVAHDGDGPAGHLGAHTFGTPIDEHPGPFLTAVVEHMRTDTGFAQRCLAATLDGTIIGAALVTEAWALPPGAVDDGRPYAERADRVDARLVLYAGVDGYQTGIIRLRGEPVPMPYRALPGMVDVVGRFARELRRAQLRPPAGQQRRPGNQQRKRHNGGKDRSKRRR
jgi:hypothetical protein